MQENLRKTKNELFEGLEGVLKSRTGHYESTPDSQVELATYRHNSNPEKLSNGNEYYQLISTELRDLQKTAKLNSDITN